MLAPMSEAEDKRVARWRYVVPNAITSMSLLIGVLAALRATQGEFVDAGWLIVLSILLDKLDGTAARLLGSTSEFGMQLDSFADLVAFGIAPGVTAFCFISMDSYGLFAWWHSPGGNVALHAMAGVYILGACLRLAKFNVMSELDGPQKVFFGMPTTYAGGVMSLSMLVALNHMDVPFAIGVLRILPVIAMLCGFAMVSNAVLPKVTTRSNKALNVLQIGLLILAYLCGFTRTYPEYMFSLMASYGLVGFIWGYMHRGEFRGDDEPDDFETNELAEAEAEAAVELR